MMTSGGGDESSEESVNDEEDEDDVENPSTTPAAVNHNNGHHGGGARLPPPTPVTGAATSLNPSSNHFHGSSNNVNSHHHHNHHQHTNNSSGNINSNNTPHINQNQQLVIQHRKSFPPSPAGGGATAKVIRAATVWKSSDEMIGVPVPRKARSASTKRLHDWMSNGGGGAAVGGGGAEQSPQLAQTSPARGSLVSASSPSQAAPLSPSSSNASLRKKMKPNGPKQLLPPKTAATSKASSSNPEELEIEIAEVLYGLMTQSQAPPQKKEEVNRSSSPSILPPNPISASGPISAVAPKRKRPRQQVSENPGSYSYRSSPISSNQTPKSEISPPYLEKTSGSVAESGFDMSSLPEVPLPEAAVVAEDSEMKAAGEELGESVLEEEGSSSPKMKESQSPEAVKAEEMTNHEDAASGSSAVAEVSNHREEKFQIDLEAPPPQSRSSPERDGEISLTMNHKPFVADLDAEMKPKQDEKMAKSVKENGINIGGGDEQKLKSEELDSMKKAENRGRGIIDLQLDLENPEGEDGQANKFQPAHKQASPVPTPLLAPMKPSKEDSHSEKPGQPSSMPLPMSMANWPSGLPPMGYMAPIQRVVSMDGSSVSQPPIQPYFSQPRPKRCATHCYIARNIHCLQQMMKMNPFWPAAAANPASLFGSKPCNISVVPPAELHGNVSGRNASNGQDKGTQHAMFSGQTAKDKISPQPANVADANQRKQQILLQPALPPVAPNNILHGPAFIFPISHQQAAVAAASTKPPPSSTTGTVVSAANPATVGGAAAASVVPAPGGPGPATALSFNYPNMSETQYLAIMQNNGYTFPLPPVGAPPPNFRGTHPQAMPLFNGSFYSSQIIHPSQLQQQTPPQQQQGPPTASQSQSQQMQQQANNQNGSLSSGSSSSQKHLQNQQQQQQRSAGNSAGGPTIIGSLQNFQPPKNRTSQLLQQQQQHMALQQQSRQHENDAGNEDSPSTADSRGSRPPVNIYGQSFNMPMHHQNYALLTTPGALIGASANSGNSNQSEKKQQQQQQAHARNMGLKNVVESLPPAQAFAMSFAMNGATGASGIDLSSMPQKQAILQSLPESTRQNIPMMAVQQRKNFRISEEGKTGGNDSSITDEERKAGKSSTSAGQSIAFSRSELTDGSGSAPLSNSVIDSSARSLNLSSAPTKNSRPGIPGGNVGVSSSQQQAQHQQQQQMMQQSHKQQQQYAAASAAWNKNLSAPNGASYADHFSSTSSPANAKFPNPHSSFPQNLVQNSNNSSSSSQSPQWKNPSRNTPPQQVPASFATSSNASSLKILPQNQQQQQGRSQQNHSQISFGVDPNQKVQPSASPAQQQNPSSHNHNQSPTSPMMVGSPSNSSISKGASGSPRTNTSASASSKACQASSLSGNQGKNSSVPGQRSSPVGGRNVPSILGNPHISVSSSSSSKPQMQQMQQLTAQQVQLHQQQQQQIAKNVQQRAQLYFSNPYMQSQPPSTNSTPSAPGAPGYYVQRRRPDQQQQGQPQTSNGMLSLSVSLAGGTSTSDPAKALAAASNLNLKGGALTSQSILQATQFSAQSSGNQHQLMPTGFAYVHAVPAAVPVKSSEQKQPAGNDNLHACWQPEKK